MKHPPVKLSHEVLAIVEEAIGQCASESSWTIAAASIVAKVYRDLLMDAYHDRSPVYDFRNNRGYATESHQAALRMYGPSPIHRMSFEGVEEPRLLFGLSEEDGGSTR